MKSMIKRKKLKTNHCTVSNSLSLNFDIFSDESDKSFGSWGEPAVAEAEKAGTREPVVVRISGKIASSARRQSHQRGQALLQQPASMRTFIHDIYYQKTVALLFLTSGRIRNYLRIRIQIRNLTLKLRNI
jgi:hypothetical protein